MADPHSSSRGSARHLDASGSREVVYCHQCDNEWYQDDHGLECPRCGGSITEIVTPGEDDPRPNSLPQSPHPLHDHNPWANSEASDPEEADIEEHINHGPDGSTIFTSTTRSGPRLYGSTRQNAGMRRPGDDNDDPDFVTRNFQDMIGNLMGGGFRHGAPGRSGTDELFRGNEGPMPAAGYHTGTFRIGGPPGGPHIVGGRVTFTTMRGGGPSRGPENAQPGAPQLPDEIASLIGGILGGALGGPRPEGGMPPMGGLQGLFQAMLNPANARSGDAVYTQEALDQIISNLMEQHSSSNAPGPAPAESIATLPRKNLDEKMLGPEGKGECSVCMDDVTTGVEVVVLPCSHWFHEACATAWLSEHNTCPICRKGISAEAQTTHSPIEPTMTNRSRSASAIAAGNVRRAHRLSQMLTRAERGPRTEEGPSSPLHNEMNQDVREEMNAGQTNSNMPGAYLRSVSRQERRTTSSGSDRSRESTRTSPVENGSGSGNSSGPIGWIRDRFGSTRRND